MTHTESYYALHHPKKGYFVEFENKRPKTLNIPDIYEIWTEGNKEHVSGIRKSACVKVKKETETTYTIFPA